MSNLPLRKKTQQDRPGSRQPVRQKRSSVDLADISFLLLAVLGATAFGLRLLASSVSSHGAAIPLGAAHMVEAAGYAIVMLIGVGGLVGRIAGPPRLKTTPGAENRADDFVSEETVVHTLVTLSISNRATGPSARASKFNTLHTEIDAVLYERLDEYKSHRPNEGCVLLVTETIPVGSSAANGVPQLNGASAAICLARSLASKRADNTLLIDTGSAGWSSYRSGGQPAPGDAPDIIELPLVPGVYEILDDLQNIEDWLLSDDEAPSLMALAPGVIPGDWPSRLVSDSMRRLIAKARSLADLTIIYAPRAIERPETVAAMSLWTNGLMVVSGVDSGSLAAEEHAVSILNGAGAVIFGRIALDTDSRSIPLRGNSKQESFDDSETDLPIVSAV